MPSGLRAAVAGAVCCVLICGFLPPPPFDAAIAALVLPIRARAG